MKKYTLLYAEDDEETRENYVFLLQKYFKSILIAKDGKEALGLYYEHSPDILLLDISMPHVSGLDVVARIRQKDMHTPIIIMSAYSEREKLLYALNLKLDYYLLKPVESENLIALLLKILYQNEEGTVKQLAHGFCWDGKNNMLSHQDKSIKLTKKEIILLALLCDTIGQHVTHDRLILDIWDYEIPDDSHHHKLVQIIYRLNKKIFLASEYTEPFIESCYALGYKISLPLAFEDE